jgi:hypothetical protein
MISPQTTKRSFERCAANMPCTLRGPAERTGRKIPPDRTHPNPQRFDFLDLFFDAVFVFLATFLTVFFFEDVLDADFLAAFLAFDFFTAFLAVVVAGFLFALFAVFLVGRGVFGTGKS